MGCAQTKGDSDLKSQKIDKMLKEERKKLENEVKLLLLGTKRE
jgi:hypothetical protein